MHKENIKYIQIESNTNLFGERKDLNKDNLQTDLQAMVIVVAIVPAVRGEFLIMLRDQLVEQVVLGGKQVKNDLQDEYCAKLMV